MNIKNEKTFIYINLINRFFANLSDIQNKMLDISQKKILLEKILKDNLKYFVFKNKNLFHI